MARETTNSASPGRDSLLAPFETYLGGRGENFYEPSTPITVARSPARIDLMGGVADYSGSVVFEGTLGRASIVGFQPRSDNTLCVRSTWLEQIGEACEVRISLNDLRNGNGPVEYTTAAERLNAREKDRWAAYILGAIPVLEREEGVRMDSGANLLLWSDVPVGVGVASSAALEVGAMHAIAGGLGCEMSGERLGTLAQMVENRVVGAPCGIMDQVTSALGREGKLLALRCQPCEVLGHHEIPDGVGIFGISSHVEHSVGGDPYTEARVSAFMGLKIILEAKKQAGEATNKADHYLCNITPSEYRDEYRALLPERIRGEAFLEQYGETTDDVTQVNPAKEYKVRLGAEHPIFENYRVQEFITCLARARAGDRTALVEAGGLMYASHCSYGWNCGLGREETDLLVRLVREYGPENGLYGAKVTGGGSGGTVAVLADSDADKLVARVASQYSQETGLTPDIFDSTSPGSCQFGLRVYRLT
ncbi:MAG: galactokinase [Planctomycetota bacterium]